MHNLYENYPYALTLEELEHKITELKQADRDPAGFVNVAPRSGQFGTAVFLVDSTGQFANYGPSPK